MKKTIQCCMMVGAGVTMLPSIAAHSAPSEAWESERSHRLILRVPTAPMMDERGEDERPAIVDINFIEALSGAGFDGKPDLSTLHLMEVDAETGAPVPFPHNAIQKTPADRPVRWYDAVIPFNYPDFSRYIGATGGEFIFDYHDRWGYFFEAVGDWKEGRLGWVHTQRRDQPTYYAAYFDLMGEEDPPPASPPRGMIGDGSHRTEEWGSTTTGQFQTRITLDDWNGNGLMDIIAGCHRGQITWWPNLGTAEEPRFEYARMVFMEDGKPLDVGRHGSPTIVDWDGNGATDLVVSSISHGRLNYFRNVGTNEDRVLRYEGFLKADGEVIESPHLPNPEGLSPDGEQAFHRDYYSQPIFVDWNGNGHLDLLTGGYVTGRIHLYENTGERDEDGLPILTHKGEIHADGEPLDVGWCASPVVADFNGNGKLDLISGLWMKAGLGGTIHSPGETFLRFFENVGTREEPQLELRPMPRNGDWPRGGLSTPDAWDFNNNGLLDLVVSAGFDIHLIENIGTAQEPLFDAANAERILVRNGSDPLPIAGRFQDLNGNGLPDIVDGTSYYTNTGEGYPFRFGRRQSYLPPGLAINHPVQQGDGWAFHLMGDLDGDGRQDVLFGDFWGQVWFHRNLGDGQFDEEGVLVVDTTGEPIRVGPDFDGEWNFMTKQGSRLVFACADFTGNGRNDIVARDTLGKITLFEQVDSDEMVMEPGVVIGEGKGRGIIYDLDWNGNGRPDIYLPTSVNYDYILLNTLDGEGSIIWEETRFERPGIPVAGAGVTVQPVDLNGDGDLDIVITNGYRFTSLFERTFLESGYAKAEIVRMEGRDSTQAP